MTEEEKYSKEVAETILKQMGGSHFVSMTGAKALRYRTGEGFGLGALTFNIGKAGGFNDTGINYVVIFLDPSDTYTMQFYKVRKGMVRQGKYYEGSKTLIKEYKNVYFDELQNRFEETTNLLTSLFPR